MDIRGIALGLQGQHAQNKTMALENLVCSEAKGGCVSELEGAPFRNSCLIHNEVESRYEKGQIVIDLGLQGDSLQGSQTGEGQGTIRNGVDVASASGTKHLV